MRHWSAEDRIQIGTLVTDRQEQERAVVARKDGLRSTDKGVELHTGSILVVVDAKEAQEQCGCRAKLGQKCAEPGLFALKDRRQQPGLDQCLGKPGVSY